MEYFRAARHSATLCCVAYCEHPGPSGATTYDPIHFCLLPFALLSVSWDVHAGCQEPAAAYRNPGVGSEYLNFEDLLSFLRTRNTRQYAIDSTKGVDEAMYVSLEGIDQWITIRGEDHQNPVLYLCTAVQATPQIHGHSFISQRGKSTSP